MATYEKSRRNKDTIILNFLIDIKQQIYYLVNQEVKRQIEEHKLPDGFLYPELTGPNRFADGPPLKRGPTGQRGGLGLGSK
jgi:hypothetical protein